MIIKPGAHKAQAAEPAVSKKIETYQELKLEADEIARLVSVWHFIEAEQRLLKLTKMKYPLRDERSVTCRSLRTRLCAAPPAIATDAEATLVFSMILDREAELLALAEAATDAGFPGQKESELAVVRALLRLIFSPNVRMPLSRLQ